MAIHQQLDELIHRVLPVVQDFHRKGMFAPHAASINNAGALAGHALTADGTTQLSVPQAIEHFESRFSQQAKSGEIQAAGIFMFQKREEPSVSSAFLVLGRSA